MHYMYISARKGSVGAKSGQVRSGQVRSWASLAMSEEPEGIMDGWAGGGRRDERRIVEMQKYSCRSVSHALRRAAATTWG